jgi:hypothetical protein
MLIFLWKLLNAVMDLLLKGRLISVNETPKDETLSTSLLSGYEA